jgi:uncharacterized membrane protein YhhN
LVIKNKAGRAMKDFSKNKFIFIFLLIVACVLYGSAINSLTLDIIFKPLIVISLLVHLFINNGHNRKAALFAIGGLLFSLMGDVLLIFQGSNPLFFMGGLISFLIAHLLYIVYYLRSADTTGNKELKGKFIFFILMLTYGAAFYTSLYKNLGDLKLPVLLYTSVLIAMNIFALNRYGKVNDKSFKLVMTGALFFTLSDSLLAFNKFFLTIPLAGVWILATYAAAQYFIMEGIMASPLNPLSFREGVKPMGGS